MRNSICHRRRLSVALPAVVAFLFVAMAANWDREHGLPASRSSAYTEYELADTVAGKFRIGLLAGRPVGLSDARKNYYKRWPESIAAEYLRRTDKTNSIEVLSPIVNEHASRLNQTGELPDSSTLVVHLRYRPWRTLSNVK